MRKNLNNTLIRPGPQLPKRKLEPIKKDDPWLARFDPTTFEVTDPTPKQIRWMERQDRKFKKPHNPP